MICGITQTDTRLTNILCKMHLLAHINAWRICQMLRRALQLFVILIERSQGTHLYRLAVHRVSHSSWMIEHLVMLSEWIIIVNLKSLHSEKILTHYFKITKQV